MKARSDKCPSCGKQHVPGFAFCQRCGAALSPDLDGEAAIASPVAAAEIDAADEDDAGIEFEDIAPLAAQKAAPKGRVGCAGGALILLLVGLAALFFRSR